MSYSLILACTGPIIAGAVTNAGGEAERFVPAILAPARPGVDRLVSATLHAFPLQTWGRPDCVICPVSPDNMDLPQSNLGSAREDHMPLAISLARLLGVPVFNFPCGTLARIEGQPLDADPIAEAAAIIGAVLESWRGATETYKGKGYAMDGRLDAHLGGYGLAEDVAEGLMTMAEALDIKDRLGARNPAPVSIEMIKREVRHRILAQRPAKVRLPEGANHE